MFINPLNRKYSTIRKIVDRILSPEQENRKYSGKSSSLRSGSSSSSIQSNSSGGSFGYSSNKRK